MAVLPNRYLVKLATNNDYFKTFTPHLGAVRLTIGKATGISAPQKKKSGASRLLAKIVKDVPDCYAKVKLGAEEEWRTSVRKNDKEPEWNETHDFLVTDFEQIISVDIQDDDLGGDDDIGLGFTSVKEILLNGGTHELSLSHKGEPSDGRVTVHAQFYNLVADANTLSVQSGGGAQDQICGLATILIASALGLQGQRDELQPSVKVTWGDKTFQTAVTTYTPGTDIFNPSYDTAFRIPLTSALLANPGNFKITLMNKKDEAGSAEVAFQDVVSAPGMSLADSFNVGGGATVRASISVYGLQLAQ
jgi:Ca2+-dependent lipid-binding protein